METKHSKAPWTRTPGERFKHDQSAGIKGSDGLYLAAALDFNRTDRDEEVEANARLIAAAPELLETLNYIKKELQASHAYIYQPREIETWLNDMEERARLAIEKAAS